MSEAIFLGRGETAVELLPMRANRHGLITGATGTGKTVTLKVIAEAFSDLGVPVFLPDVKGDLCGFAEKVNRVSNCKNGSVSCIFQTLNLKVIPCGCGVSYKKRDTPYALRFLKWGRCCSLSC